MLKALILPLVATVLAASLPGCGGDGGEIPKSENAPSQDDMNKMADFMSKQGKAPKAKKKN